VNTFIQTVQTVDAAHTLEQEESISWLQWAVGKSVAPREERLHAQSFLEKLKASDAISYRHSMLGDFESASMEGLTLFANEGVHVHQSALHERMVRHEESALSLLDTLLPDAPPPDALFYVTCTGYTSPTPVQTLADRRGWHGVLNYHIGHMGCYAAFPALRLAQAHVASGMSPTADILHVELCTLHFRPSDTRPGQLIVQTLFADGAARVHVTSQPSGKVFRIVASDEALLPHTGKDMTWKLDNDSFLMTLSREVPVRIRAKLADAVDTFLARNGLQRSDIAGWAIHPGGPRIIDAAAAALQLPESAIVHSRSVLKNNGNMSSATIPHIWKHMLADDNIRTGDYIVSMAFGPGLTLVLNLLEVQHHA
jgi:predicted naringenin-chalcone synthase